MKTLLRNKFLRPNTAQIAVALAGMLVTSSLSTIALAESKLEQVQKSGSLSIGMAVEPPITNFDGEKLSGAVPEVLMAVMKKLGIKDIKVRITDWGSMIPGLLARRYDVVATGLYIRPDRCKAILFSQPDTCSTWGFAVKAGNPKKLKGMTDLVKTGANLGSCGGCVAEKKALEAGVPRKNILTVTDPLSGMKMLEAGRIDALVYIDVSLFDALKKSGVAGVEVVAPLTDEVVSCSGVGFHPDDQELRNAFDKALAEMKASGEYASIVKPYGLNPQYAIDTTREQLCGGTN